MNGCAPTEKRANLFPNKSHVCLSVFNSVLGTTFVSAAEIYSAHFAEHKASLPTAEEIAANKAKSDALNKEFRKQQHKELQQLKEKNICPRCHGEGGSSAWLATGWTCHRCFGSGKYFN